MTLSQLPYGGLRGHDRPLLDNAALWEVQDGVARIAVVTDTDTEEIVRALTGVAWDDEDAVEDKPVRTRTGSTFWHPDESCAKTGDGVCDVMPQAKAVGSGVLPVRSVSAPMIVKIGDELVIYLLDQGRADTPSSPDTPSSSDMSKDRVVV